MRKIDYIFIDSDSETRDSQPGRHAVSLFRHHLIVNAEGLLTNTIDIRQREALIQRLVQLRHLYPNAKILGVSELDDKAPDSKNIIVSDAMNALRRELSDYP